MPLKIYNTLERAKQEFKPLVPGHVGIYVCGPTVYGPAHLGHAKSYVGFDVVVRWLRHSGYQVRYVQNITDVGHLVSDADEGEDKIAKEARARGLQPMEVAERWTREYFEDMDALGVLRPDISPRATGHVPEQIELVQLLIAKGLAYEAGGSVYFDVSQWSGPDKYGKLSGRVVEEAETGTRVAGRDEKRNPADFALWKKADPTHIMQWNSPWGRGFPGWHVECSAMSMKYLGETFDIHGGGQDNRFPHHEDERAQSEGATGKEFARYWMHNGLVTINGQKMGKSLGNYISLKELFGELPIDGKRRDIVKIAKAYDPLTVRFLILQNNYGSNLDISEDNLRAAESGLRKLTDTVLAVRKALPSAPVAGPERTVAVAEQVHRDFTAAMNEDFNTPAAIASLFTLRDWIAGQMASGAAAAEELAAADLLFRKLGGEVLGVVLDEYPQQSTAALTEPLVKILVEARSELRKPAAEIGKAAKKMPPEFAEPAKAAADKIFQSADDIRKKLAELGIILEDTPKGTVWKMGK